MRVELRHRPEVNLDDIVIVRHVRSTTLWSRFVWLMRGVLPGAVVGLLVLLVAWPQLMVPNEKIMIGTADPMPGQGGNPNALTMVNPRYYGVDTRTRPYSVSADTANQAGAETGAILLDKPRADTVMRDGAGVLLDAERGVFYNAKQKVDLYGNVNVYQDQGYEIHTDEAHVDLAAGIAEGDKPIQGHGPSIQLEGDGFKLLDNGRTIYLNGNSRVVLYPASKGNKP
jgi:lipopolysaccharide export system protein LptC